MAIGHPVTGLSDPDLVDTTITPSVAPVRIPRDRYTSATFAAMEAERMWPFAWQIACTIDHVPEPGDFFEYVTGNLSVLVEAAVRNHILHTKGYDASKAFIERQKRRLENAHE